jgi:branched-chain amino acid transport system substrate-binding protein
MRRAQTAATMSLALGVACALLASCSSRNANDASQNSSGSSTPATNSKTINIAEIVFLSGPVATFGQELDHGGQIALQQINAAGGIKGKKLVISKCDTQSTTPKAVACAGSALSSDASAIIAFSGTDDQLSWIPDAQKAGMPVLSNSIADQVPAIGNEVMQVVPPDADLIPSFITTLKAKLGLKTIAFLHDTDSAASVASYQAFKSDAVAAGLKVVADQGYLSTDTTWSSQLLNIKSAHPDAIVEVPYAAEGGSVLIQARQLGLKQPILGGSSLNSPAALQQAGAAGANVYVPDFWSLQDNSSYNTYFVSHYKSEFGTVPDRFGATGYNEVELLAQILRNSANPNSRADNTTALDAITSWHYAGCAMTVVDRSPVCQTPVVLKSSGGQFVLYATGKQTQ